MQNDLERLADAIPMMERMEGYYRGSSPEAMAFRDRLVQCLARACDRFGVEPEELVNELVEVCKRVPTDSEIYTAAESLRALKNMKHRPEEPRSRDRPHCSKCNGSGWEIVYWLHTMERGFVRKEKITKQVFDSFAMGKLDPLKQNAFSGAKRCACDEGDEAWTPEARREHDAKWTAFIADPKNAKLVKGLGPMIAERLGV